jgi:hypothetical protein
MLPVTRRIDLYLIGDEVLDAKRSDLVGCSNDVTLRKRFLHDHGKR